MRKCSVMLWKGGQRRLLRDTGFALDFLHQIWIWTELCIIKEMGIMSTRETDFTVQTGEQCY